MPYRLKRHIEEVTPPERKTIWVSCEGESPADTENMGPIKFIPRQGFPGYYFPYKITEAHLNPLVAVHFESPRSKFPFCRLYGIMLDN